VVIDFSLVYSRVVNKSRGSFDTVPNNFRSVRKSLFDRENGDLHYIYLSSAAGIAETHLNLHSIPVSNHRRAEPGGGKNNNKRGTGFSRDCGMSS